MQVTRYDAGQRAEWDAFVDAASNGTFLFRRSYVEYHADRFDDCSLLLRDARGRLVALLPAHRTPGGALHTHQGLTYGGFVVKRPYTAQLIACFNALNAWCEAQGIGRVTYKPVPFIYAAHPAQADLYCLFRLGATLTTRNLSTTVEQGDALAPAPPLAELRRRGARKAVRLGLTVRESDDFAAFWELLTDHLRDTYAAAPTHTLAEINELRVAFPANIRLHVVTDAAGTLLAGVVLFLTPRVAHVQYVAAPAAGRAAGALDLLFAQLLRETYAGHRYFDFGTSNAQNGQYLNQSLLFQKEGFGGRGVCYDTYAYDPAGRID